MRVKTIFFQATKPSAEIIASPTGEKKAEAAGDANIYLRWLPFGERGVGERTGG